MPELPGVDPSRSLALSYSYLGRPGGGRGRPKRGAAGEPDWEKRVGNGKGPPLARGAFDLLPAATYSPTRSPVQYHRRWRA